MANYGPFNPGFAGSPQLSNSGGGAFDIAGYPTATPAINSDLVKKSFATMVQYLLPKGDATLFGLSARLKEETATQIEHGFYSKVLVFPLFQAAVNTAITNVATTISAVDAGSAALAIPNGLYKFIGYYNTSNNAFASVDTTLGGEIIQVTSVSGTTITVARNIGDSAGTGVAGQGTAYTATVNLAPVFVHVGNAFADASTRPNSVLTKEIRVVNYTQIFRNAWAISGTVAAIQNLVGDTNIAKSRNECAQYHAKDIEASMIFGKGAISSGITSGSANYQGRTMNGIIAQIKDSQAAGLFLPGQDSSSNIKTANSSISGTPTAGALSLGDFEDWANSLFDMSYDPASALERVVFVGRTSHVVINRLARANATYFLENGKTEWGLRFSRFHLTRGDLIIIEHPLLNTNFFWQTLAIALDISAISIAYMIGRKTKSEEYNQAGTAIDNAIDAVGGSLLSELTIMNKNPAGCGVMTNIRQAVGPAGTVVV